MTSGVMKLYTRWRTIILVHMWDYIFKTDNTGITVEKVLRSRLDVNISPLHPALHL